MKIIYNQNKLFSEPKAEFGAWTKKNPGWQDRFNIKREKGGHSNYGRMIVVWDEEDESSAEIRKNVYAPSINLRTGEFYLDCRKRKIFAKFSTFVFLRPLHTLAFTLYHGLGIGVAKEIIQTIRGKQTAKEGLKNSFHSLQDIVRTPLYGIVLSVIDVSAVVLAAFKPNSLYKMREISGKIEMARFRTTDGTDGSPLLAPCFTPLGKIQGDMKWDDPEYFSKAQVRFRRNHNALFNDCLHLFPKDKAYVSAAYHSIDQGYFGIE